VTTPVKLDYQDPGAARELPQPPHVSFVGGEKVRLKKAQEYADGVVVAAGEVGVTIAPSSQAASWSVNFAKAGRGKPRVVPEWLLERTGPPKKAHGV
jgi:hypothetical protein